MLKKPVYNAEILLETPSHSYRMLIRHRCPHHENCASESWYVFQYHWLSFSQLWSPCIAQPFSMTTKSPSRYPSPRFVCAYDAIVRCGTSAILERIVGCHCTICSCSSY